MTADALTAAGRPQVERLRRERDALQRLLDSAPPAPPAPPAPAGKAGTAGDADAAGAEEAETLTGAAAEAAAAPPRFCCSQTCDVAC